MLVGEAEASLAFCIKMQLAMLGEPHASKYPIEQAGEKHPGFDCVGVNVLVWAELGWGGGRRAGRGGKAFHSSTEQHEVLQGCLFLKTKERGKGMMASGRLEEKATLRCPAKNQFFRCQCHIRQKLSGLGTGTDAHPAAGGMQEGLATSVSFP